MEKISGKGRKKSKTSILVTIGIFVVGGVLLFTLLGLVSEIREKKDELSLAQAYYDNVTAVNNEFKALLSSDDYVQTIARDKHGFILPGEEVFVDISGN